MSVQGGRVDNYYVARDRTGGWLMGLLLVAQSPYECVAKRTLLSSTRVGFDFKVTTNC